MSMMACAWDIRLSSLLFILYAFLPSLAQAKLIPPGQNILAFQPPLFTVLGSWLKLKQCFFICLFSFGLILGILDCCLPDCLRYCCPFIPVLLPGPPAARVPPLPKGGHWHGRCRDLLSEQLSSQPSLVLSGLLSTVTLKIAWPGGSEGDAGEGLQGDTVLKLSGHRNTLQQVGPPSRERHLC